MQDYEEKVKELRYKRVKSFSTGDLGGFKVKQQPKKSPPKDTEVYDKLFENEQQDSGPPEFDVPLRRFEIINKKIKSFPLLEKDGNVRIMDFGDGFGAVYAYRWKNDPNQGWVSYWAQFENPENITIDKDSTVSSNSYLFAKKGSINIVKTRIITTQIWAEGSVEINNCETIKDCYIFGSLSLNKTPILERNRFFTSNCSLIKCTVSGNNLFLQDAVDTGGTIGLTGTNISGNCEIIGSVTDTQSTISGKARISGKVTLSQSTVSDNAYINAGKSGHININQATISNSAVIINNAKITKSQVSGSALIGDNASVVASNVSGTAMILDNANVNGCSVTGNALINMQAKANGTTFSGNCVMTGNTTAGTAVLSGVGILSGNGTSKPSGKISGGQKVFDGVSCKCTSYDRHWDHRSCGTSGCNIDFLLDEREACVCPDCPTCKNYMCPPTIC